MFSGGIAGNIANTERDVIMSKVIKQQWQQMINNGTMPLFEIQITESDYLLVDLELSDNGIRFAFDTRPVAPYNVLPVSFD